MDDATLSALEFGAVKQLVAEHIRTPFGRRALERLSPSADRAVVAARLDRAREAMRHRLEGGSLGPGSLGDPAPLLERLGPSGAVLEPAEILLVVSVLEASAALRAALEAVRETLPRIWEVASRIPDLREVSRSIAGRITSDGGVDDSASDELRKIRRRIATLEGKLQRALRRFLEVWSDRGVLQDSYITIRNGRFVVPLRAESRASVPGIVHGVSSTGATSFVEPMETLEINNEVVTLREGEQAEIKRVLFAWSELLRSRLADIEKACELLAELDLLDALGAFGIAYDCTVPGDANAAGGAGRLHLEEARHPVLHAELRKRGESPVPLSLEIEASGALVLSGPNAGGKTVALKTIGLIALMNQSGIPVPAREAVLPVFREILADIGDHQSILESLSTFSARMARVAHISRALVPPALVLLDEVAAGTDPAEAGALAVAIVEHLQGRGASVVATTHHEALKSYAGSAPRAVNASMEVDGRMRPTFRLVSGIPGHSGGLDLAERFGLPGEVVAAARSRLSAEHLEARRYLVRLRESAEARDREERLIRERRGELEAELARVRSSLEKERETLRREWREALDAALDRIEQAREELVSGIGDRILELQVRSESREQAHKLRSRLRRTAAPPQGQQTPSADITGGGSRKGTDALLPGAPVRVKGIAERGRLESLESRGRAVVSFGAKRMTVRVSDLSEATPGDPADRAGSRAGGVFLSSSDKLPTPSEINLIGATTEEARGRLDKFLDDAYLAGHREVRIVHGHGTGRLRAAVRALLEQHVHVELHAAADEKAGGEGATVAILRS